MMTHQLSIKDVADETGLSIHTLRYYERIGLLDPVHRLPNGHRRYDGNDLRRIDFLKRLRSTGMRISEMQAYVELYRAGPSTLDERLRVLVAHREAVQQQINELCDTLAFLDEKIERYKAEMTAEQNKDFTA